MKLNSRFKYVVLVAALGASLGSAPVQAQMVQGGVGYVGLPNSGIVHFFGRIRDAACTATVNGQGPTGYVILREAMVGEFPNVGDTGNEEKFYIELTDCFEGISTGKGVDAWPYFFGGHSNVTTGRLENIPGIGQAIGIDLQLTNGSGVPFKVGQGTSTFGSHGPWLSGISGAGPHKIDYGVWYYRKSGITAGAIRSNVDYIVYFQ